MQRYLPLGMLILVIGILVWGVQLLTSAKRISMPVQRVTDTQAEQVQIQQYRIRLNALADALKQREEVRASREEAPILATILPEAADAKKGREDTRPAAPPEPRPVLSLIYLSDNLRRATIDGQVVGEGAQVGRRWTVSQQMFLPAPEGEALGRHQQGGAG